MAVVGLLLGTAIYAKSSAKVKYPLLASLFSFANKRRRREKKRRDQEEHEEEEEDKIDSKPLLRWKNIALAVEKKTKQKDTKAKTTLSILSNVSGEAKSGRLLAIVGPSGAGKTSLLNALAKRVPRKGARLTGERLESERARVGFDFVVFTCFYFHMCTYTHYCFVL